MKLADHGDTHVIPELGKQRQAIWMNRRLSWFAQ